MPDPGVPLLSPVSSLGGSGGGRWWREGRRNWEEKGRERSWEERMEEEEEGGEEGDGTTWQVGRPSLSCPAHTPGQPGFAFS